MILFEAKSRATVMHIHTWREEFLILSHYPYARQIVKETKSTETRSNMSYYQQPFNQPPHYYPSNWNSDVGFQREFPPQTAEVYTNQPYHPFPMVAPQSTVFIYDDQPSIRSQREEGLLAAFCAACLCCWLLPPYPTWHCWYRKDSRQFN